jgi:hypothetical protein
MAARRHLLMCNVQFAIGVENNTHAPFDKSSKGTFVIPAKAGT